MNNSDHETLRNRQRLRDGLHTLAWFGLLAGVLLLHVWFPPVDSGQLNDTFSVDLGGRNAIYQFVERRGFRTRRNFRPLERLAHDLDPNALLCLLGPARMPTEREWQALLGWVGAGGQLLVAAPWKQPEIAVPELGARVVALGAPQVQGPPAGPAAMPPTPPRKAIRKPARAGPHGQDPNPRGLRDALLAAAGQFSWNSTARLEIREGDVLIRAPQGIQAARIPHGSGWVVLVASDYVFSNKALFQRETSNGELAVRLLESAGMRGTVVFDESLNVSGTPRVVGILLDPLIRPATVQMAVLLVLFAWSGSRRFGRPLPPVRPPRHDVTAHADALGNLYFRSSGGVAALNAYLEQMKSALKLRYAGRRSAAAMNDLARRSGMSAAEVSELFDQAAQAADRSLLHRRDAAHLIRRLARLWQAVRRSGRA